MLRYLLQGRLTFRSKEDIGACGIAVFGSFSRDVALISIIAVLSRPSVRGVGRD